MRRIVRTILLAIILSLLPPLPQAGADLYDVQIANMKAYRISGTNTQLLPITRLVHIELEHILEGVTQPVGVTRSPLPPDYLLFRLSSPAVASPIAHPIHELIVTLPRSAGDPPRLLVKNQGQKWMEYRTKRPLTTIIHQLERR